MKDSRWWLLIIAILLNIIVYFITDRIECFIMFCTLIIVGEIERTKK